MNWISHAYSYPLYYSTRKLLPSDMRRLNVKLIIETNTLFCSARKSFIKNRQTWLHRVLLVPRRGIASDTLGRVAVTMLWKTVSERRMVTPKKV